MEDPGLGGLGMPVTRLAGAILSSVGVLGLIYAALVVLFMDPGTAGVGPFFAVGAGSSGLIGFVWCVVWRGKVMAAPIAPRRFLVGTIVAAAVSELGLFIGVTGYVVSGDSIGAAVGSVLFVLCILVLGTTISAAEFEMPAG